MLLIVDLNPKTETFPIQVLGEIDDALTYYPSV